jgi:hypothetical protein
VIFMKNTNMMIAMALLVIVVGGGAFYGGMKYQASKQSAFGRQFTAGGAGMGGRNGQAAGPGGQLRGNRPVNGDIISADDKSITVKMTDGSSKIVILSAQTSINKASAATITDLKVGEKVAVFGQANSDGSVTAQNIQLNPIQRESGASPAANPVGQ